MRLIFIVILFASTASAVIKIDKGFTATTTREYYDSSRSNWPGTGYRPVRVTIWYPEQIDAKKKETESTKSSESFSTFPLIIISPGSGQNALSMQWLADYLSTNGFITAAISHTGTEEEERQTGPISLTDFCIWERPADILVVLDNILSDPFFADKIDTSRIGAAGFSLGGATVIWAAGGKLDLDTLQANSPPPPPFLVEQINKYLELSKTDPVIIESYTRAEKLFKDERIKGVFSLAPAVGYAFSKEGLSNVTVPVKIVVGDKDLVAPAETNAKRYAEYIKNASLTVLPGERGHFITTTDEGEKSRELAEVCQMALEFFREVLN